MLELAVEDGGQHERGESGKAMGNLRCPPARRDAHLVASR